MTFWKCVFVLRIKRILGIAHYGLNHNTLLTSRHNGQSLELKWPKSRWRRGAKHTRHISLLLDDQQHGYDASTFQSWRCVRCHLHFNEFLTKFTQAFAAPNSSTAAAVTFITFVQDLKKKTKAWAPMIELCANGEKTLERFRYQFPEDWLYSDQLRGEWSAYNEILKRKNDSIQEQLGNTCLIWSFYAFWRCP
jgi:hypothetical protein